MILEMLIAVSFAAEPTAAAKKSFAAQVAKVKAASLAPKQAAVEQARKYVAKDGDAKTGELLAQRRKILADAEAVDYTPMTLLPSKVKRGDIGYIRIGTVIERLSDTETVVELSEINHNGKGQFREPYIGPTPWRVIVRGADVVPASAKSVEFNRLFHVVGTKNKLDVVEPCEVK